MGNKIFLVLGGSRSGKSEFAEELMYHSTGEKKRICRNKPNLR